MWYVSVTTSLFTTMFGLLLVVSVITIGALVDGNPEECLRLSEPDLIGCCKEALPIGNNVKDCFNLAKPPSCEVDLCMAKKFNFQHSDDGKFDEKSLEEFVIKNFDAKVAEAVVEHCVKGDLSKYGTPEFCDLTKFRHCITVGAAKTCPEWNTEGPCAEVKALIEKCQKNK